ncbi:MAG: hypothetical protein ACI9F2_000983 [Lysobacterales bacterium]|jgi:uncharacterized protein YqeY
MSLEQQITKDYITAMKAKDSIKSQTINGLRAQIKNVIIERRVDKVEDIDVITIVKKGVKQRKDSILQFTEAERMDLVEKEKIEMDILKVYLPAELSTEKIETVVAEVIAEVGATSMKDMGSVMKGVTEKTGGAVDSKIASDIVKAKLAG